VTVTDERRAPFCWQSIPALKRLRGGWPDNSKQNPRPRLVMGLAVYQALTEIANEGRSRPAIGSSSNGFEAARSYIAKKAGVDKRSVDAVLAELERLGLLRVTRRRKGRMHAPSLYVLLEPEGGEDSSPPSEDASPGVAKDARQGGGDRSPGVAKTVRPFQEESQEEEEVEEDPASPTCLEVENVWGRYRRSFNPKRSAPRDTERAVIEAALRVASEEECCRAIDALAGSEWHRQQGATTLVTVFRKKGESMRDRIDYWLDLAARQEEEATQATEDDDLDVDQVRREQGLEP